MLCFTMINSVLFCSASYYYTCRNKMYLRKNPGEVALPVLLFNHLPKDCRRNAVCVCRFYVSLTLLTVVVTAFACPVSNPLKQVEKAVHFAKLQVLK